MGSGSHDTLPSYLYIIWPRHLKSLNLLLPTVKEEMNLKEKILIELWPWNIAQYPLHYVTYAHTKFEVAMSNSLGEDTITRNPQPHRRTLRQTTNFGTKLIYPIFLRKIDYDSFWNHVISNTGVSLRLTGPPVSYSIFFLLNQEQISLLLKKPTDQEQHYPYKSVIPFLHDWNGYKYTS